MSCALDMVDSSSALRIISWYTVNICINIVIYRVILQPKGNSHNTKLLWILEPLASFIMLNTSNRSCSALLLFRNIAGFETFLEPKA